MAQVSQAAPNLEVREWVQGTASNIDRERGKVILIEVFQVNCPGCFIAGIPEAIKLHEQFKDRGLVIWGLATAFEDFELNTLENLKKLLRNGEVVGETLVRLGQGGFLENRCLSYKIPFPVAMDRIVKNSGNVTEESVASLIRRDIPEFARLPPQHQQSIRRQVMNYLRDKPYDALTFDAYRLRGTPSFILIDKKGILRHGFFGSGHNLEHHIRGLLDE